jgi:hypothetical protein
LIRRLLRPASGGLLGGCHAVEIIGHLPRIVLDPNEKKEDR